VTNIILCGGNGTRLWPLSRNSLPKQYLKLFEDKSLLQKTIERNAIVADSCMMVSNTEQYFIALDQLEELNNKKFQLTNTKFLLEEIGKNTAPAIAFAALESDYDEILFITPSDHLISDETTYQKLVIKAKELARQNFLVTFGIHPNNPNTGYGYIETNDFDVIKFHEKPTLEKAKKYIQQGNYLWNSGMFMFKAGVYLEKLQEYAPLMYEEILKSYAQRQIINSNQIRLKKMKNIPEDSIDYTVMEKSNNIKVIPSNFGWNDVGSFDSLIEEIPSKHAIEIDSKNNFYHSNKLIATIGIENLIVIDTPDALLISKKGETQKVKDIVQVLKESYKHLAETHIKVHRPWGTYEELLEDDGYKIKRIIVKPNKRLSLQKHFHRNEHWIVVSGTAEVTVGKRTYLVRPNESTYIKMGEIHRLKNPGKVPVVLIEAQVGEYTSEDDIIRLEDDFQRING